MFFTVIKTVNLVPVLHGVPAGGHYNDSSCSSQRGMDGGDQPEHTQSAETTNYVLCCLLAPIDTSLNASSTRRSILVSSADIIHKCDGVIEYIFYFSDGSLTQPAMCATLEEHFTKSSLWFTIRKPNLAALHMNRYKVESSSQ